MQKLACLLTLRASRVFSLRTPLREFRTRREAITEANSCLVFGPRYTPLAATSCLFLFLYHLLHSPFVYPFPHFFFSFVFQTLISTAFIDHLDFIQGDHNVR